MTDVQRARLIEAAYQQLEQDPVLQQELTRPEHERAVEDIYYGYDLLTDTELSLLTCHILGA